MRVRDVVVDAVVLDDHPDELVDLRSGELATITFFQQDVDGMDHGSLESSRRSRDSGRKALGSSSPSVVSSSRPPSPG